MAYFDLGIFSHVLNSTFLSGFLGGISVAWLFFKSQSTRHVENAAFCPENSSTCGEVSWIGRDMFGREEAYYVWN